jgi:ParB family chromosome partitioning protein
MEIRQSRIEEIPTRAIQGNSILAISVGSRELERCEKAIRQYGFIQPVVVRRVENRYQVLDGECERRVLARMRRSKTSAVVVEGLEGPEATRLALLLCALKRSPTALSEGLLLKELCQDGQHSQTEMASLVGRSVSWINKRLALAERLAASVVDMVKAGRLSPHVAQEIARMPIDVQQTFANKVIMERLPKSVVERLVSTYNHQGVPGEVKKAVLEDPRTVLGQIIPAKQFRGRRAKEDKDPGSMSFDRLRNTLNMLFRLAGEAHGLLVCMTTEEKQALEPILQQCVQAFWRFSRLAATSQPDFSPGKNRVKEVEAHGH